MKVKTSDIMEGNTSYWYEANETYEVKEYTAISYEVTEGEHKGKIIYHGHCRAIE